jgi:hypothetical protein
VSSESAFCRQKDLRLKIVNLTSIYPSLPKEVWILPMFPYNEDRSIPRNQISERRVGNQQRRDIKRIFGLLSVSISSALV